MTLSYICINIYVVPEDDSITLFKEGHTTIVDIHQKHNVILECFQFHYVLLDTTDLYPHIISVICIVSSILIYDYMYEQYELDTNS